MNQYKTIFLQMNREIDQNTMDILIKNKKKKLPQGLSLMSWDTFKEFCSKRKPLNKVRSE